MRIVFSILLCLTAFSLTGQKTESKPPYSLDELQRRHFLFFWELADSVNYQVPDRYPSLTFSSIAATGFGLTTYLVGAERGWITRKQAAERVLKTLQVLRSLPQGPERSGVAGFRGFFYHFLDLQKALRFQQVELSSIDTGLLMAGILSCYTYFDGNDATETEIRNLADFLYRRVEWDWFLNEQNRMSMGWHPERGFLGADWRGYNEAMVLVLMAIGSPTHPVSPEMWKKWCEPYYWAPYKGQEMVNFGPLFGHQYSHIWVDFKGIQDDYMRKKGIDYFENSRRATYANRQYCIDNPFKFKGYSENIWGLTASDGPADRKHTYEGREITFHTYTARGVAADYWVDDGTIVPTAAGGSTPFAPEICLPALEAMWKRFPVGPYGFYDAYNETYTWGDAAHPSQPGVPYWVDKDYLGIDQGPIVLMIENYRSGFIWDLMKRNPYIVSGLKRAGFSGGWLDKTTIAIKDSATVSLRSNPDVPVEPAGYFQRALFQDDEKFSLPYQLMTPWQPRAGKKYPLVVFLHGSGERGSDNAGQMTNGVYAFAEKHAREVHPCYLLVPQCPRDTSWVSFNRKSANPQYNAAGPTAPARATYQLIRQLIQQHPDIDTQRIYLTGLSMGGFGTFEMLVRYPEMFAAGMPLCGGTDPNQAVHLQSVPLWVFHGGLDDVVPPYWSRNIVQALEKIKSPVRYTEYSTLRHDIWYQTYYNPEVMEWLFNQRKKP